MMKLSMATRRVSAVVQAEAIIIATIGIVALIGYFCERPDVSGWGAAVPMAPSTAVCFIAAAAAVWSLASVNEKLDKGLMSLPCSNGGYSQIIERLERIEGKIKELKQ